MSRPLISASGRFSFKAFYRCWIPGNNSISRPCTISHHVLLVCVCVCVYVCARACVQKNVRVNLPHMMPVVLRPCSSHRRQRGRQNTPPGRSRHIDGLMINNDSTCLTHSRLRPPYCSGRRNRGWMSCGTTDAGWGGGKVGCRAAAA